jgi:signal transduction histidine kinase
MRFSIRSKILLSFSILIAVTFLVMLFFINKSIVKNNEDIIFNDLCRIDRDVKIYTGQYLALNNISNPESEVNNIRAGLLEDLNSKLATGGVWYFQDGRAAGGAYDMDGGLAEGEDLRLALKKESAVTIGYDTGNVTAVFSIPLLFENELAGVYRFSKNYSELYKAGQSLIRTISLFAVIACTGVIAVSLLLSYGILKPLQRLRDYALRLGDGDFDAEIDIGSGDEIGDLALQFSRMKDRIHRQVLAIQKEHARLRQMESYRKQFFDNITHEFKTPLTIIAGFAQMIEETGFSDRELLAGGIGHIREESQRLHRMVVRLLDISRKTHGGEDTPMEEFNISDLLASVCRNMDMEAKSRNIRICTAIALDLYVYGSRDDLKSVFTNIIDNAIKYGRSDTCIEIEAFREGEQVKITVRDHGIGIPVDLREKVFEPFFRAAPDRPGITDGSGLGLFIARQILDNHHGAISISSVEHQGTAVQVYIPAKSLQE